MYQGVLNLESTLGTKILKVLLAEKKPRNTVFKQSTYVLITPHSYYTSEFREAFDTNDTSGLFKKYHVQDACELGELLEELEDDGYFEPMSEHNHVFLVAGAEDMEKLSTTGFARWKLGYDKWFNKNKNVIYGVAIGAAVVTTAALTYVFKDQIVGTTGDIWNHLFNGNRNPNANPDITYTGGKIQVAGGKMESLVLDPSDVNDDGAKGEFSYWSKKVVDNEVKDVRSTQDVRIKGKIDSAVIHNQDHPDCLFLGGCTITPVSPTTVDSSQVPRSITFNNGSDSGSNASNSGSSSSNSGSSTSSSGSEATSLITRESRVPV